MTHMNKFEDLSDRFASLGIKMTRRISLARLTNMLVTIGDRLFTISPFIKTLIIITLGSVTRRYSA